MEGFAWSGKKSVSVLQIQPLTDIAVLQARQIHSPPCRCEGIGAACAKAEEKAMLGYGLQVHEVRLVHSDIHELLETYDVCLSCLVCQYHIERPWL